MILEDCQFCRVANFGDATAKIVKNWEDAVALSPLEPATAGHLLVIPKKHYADALELSPEAAGSVWERAIEVGKHARDRLAPDGMNILTSVGEAATQSVFHMHIHVLPRYKGDRIVDFWPNSGITTEEEDRALAMLRSRAFKADR